MDTEPVKGSWEEQKKKLKARFRILTQADLNAENSNNEEMLNRIQLKLGKTRKEMIAILSAL